MSCSQIAECTSFRLIPKDRVGSDDSLCRTAPMNLDAHGESKYVTGDLLQSALSCNWPGIAAELRRHPAGELPPFDLAQTEIGIATSCDPNSVVTRRGNGLWQRTRVAPGVIWTCPAGVREEDIAISAWHECLHIIYLPCASSSCPKFAVVLPSRPTTSATSRACMMRSSGKSPGRLSRKCGTRRRPAGCSSIRSRWR